MQASEKIRVCPLLELQTNSSRTVRHDGRSILVCNSEDEIFAIANECSHAFQPLEGGVIRNGWIACPAHGARFELSSGQALTRPASEPVETFPILIEDGEIFVIIPSIA